MNNITIAILFLIIALLVAIFFKPSKITNYPSVGSSIVMLGDSLTYGVGASEGKDLPALLSKKIGMHVVNMGVPRETTGEGLKRVEKVIDTNPRVVLVLLGGNDYLQHVPQEETFRNIDEIVTTLQEFGAVVVLLGIQGGILSDSYASEFKKIAKNRGTLYVPNVLDGIIGHNELMSDQVHPNDDGYEIIAKKIYPVLKKAL